MFDINNSSSNEHTLCETCKCKQVKRIKAKKVEEFTYCQKWDAIVEGVGVCKYYVDKEKDN